MKRRRSFRASPRLSWRPMRRRKASSVNQCRACTVRSSFPYSTRALANGCWREPVQGRCRPRRPVVHDALGQGPGRAGDGPLRPRRPLQSPPLARAGPDQDGPRARRAGARGGAKANSPEAAVSRSSAPGNQPVAEGLPLSSPAGTPTSSDDHKRDMLPTGAAAHLVRIATETASRHTELVRQTLHDLARRGH